MVGVLAAGGASSFPIAYHFGYLGQNVRVLSYPCAIRKFLVEISVVTHLVGPLILFLLSSYIKFLFCGDTIAPPRPIVMRPPVWHLILGCTTKDASIHIL